MTPSKSSKKVSTVVLLIFDTLRRDYREFFHRGSGVLSGFQRLESLCPVIQPMVAGSFPTVPMRTDLLTGRLAFLDRRWATPTPTEPILTETLSVCGIDTILVSDNYVLFEPSLKAQLQKHVDRSVEIRGCGADPWAPLQTYPWLRRTARPVREPAFERQYVSNARRWEAAGGAPWERLVRAACDVLDERASRRRFVWIDCFSTHEPWYEVPPADRDVVDVFEPISPPYGALEQYPGETLQVLGDQFSARLRNIDRSLQPLVDRLEAGVARGDTAIVVMTDHGFLFGEFGLVGKPKEDPVLSPLHQLVCRWSPPVECPPAPGVALQPHELSTFVAELLDVSFPGPDPRCVTPDAPRIIGRQSPQVRTMLALIEAGALVLFRDYEQREPSLLPDANLNSARPWEEQLIPATIKPATATALLRILDGHRWAEEFNYARTWLRRAGGATRTSVPSA